MTFTFTFTEKQLKLLIIAIRAGIGDDSIENIGLTKRDQFLLGKVANDLTEAVTHKRPYWEQEP